MTDIHTFGNETASLLYRYGRAGKRRLVIGWFELKVDDDRINWKRFFRGVLSCFSSVVFFINIPNNAEMIEINTCLRVKKRVTRVSVRQQVETRDFQFASVSVLVCTPHRSYLI